MYILMSHPCIDVHCTLHVYTLYICTCTMYIIPRGKCTVHVHLQRTDVISLYLINFHGDSNMQFVVRAVAVRLLFPVPAFFT